MDRVDRALGDLVKMIGSERDARRAGVRRLQGHIEAIQQDLKAIHGELAESDVRTSGHESAVIDTLGALRSELSGQDTRVDALEQRVSDIEARLDDKAS